jgi:hypothetical protein
MQKKYANKHKTFSFEYELEDMIWLFIKNIKIERSFRKLNHKWIESYKMKKLSKDACQLNLSLSMKIHDTFHIFFLRFAAIDFLIDQIQSSSSSIVIDEKEEYEVNDILDSRYHYEKLQYKIVWIDHFSDRAWYSTKNFENSKNILWWRMNAESRNDQKKETVDRHRCRQRIKDILFLSLCCVMNSD